ncbi:MAG: XRE family transcriptional regulator [Vicinamibacteraceae bacterium]
MSTIVPLATAALAARLKTERDARGWSVAELAERSGVSRAMISKVERAEASPTAALLGKLSGAFGLTLSALLARAEQAPGRLARRAEQPQWTDPDTRYRRRTVSPSTGGPLEIVEVDLPVGASTAFPAAAYTFRYHQILVLTGTLTLIEGDTRYTLGKGDCLELGPPAPVTYANRTKRPCTYLVMLVRS